jgi:hypothetical protein
MLNALGALSPGTQLNRMADALGLPDQVGDMLGAAVDAQMGNAPGALRNLLDGFSKLSTGQLDFGAIKSLAKFGSIASPQKMLGQLSSAVLGSFAGGGQGLQALAGNLMGAGGPMGGISNLLGRLMGGAVPGSPHSQGGAVTSDDRHARSGKASPLETGGESIRSIINNPNLSIEEKMALALMKMAEKQEAKLEAQLDKMSQKQGAPDGGGKGGGGLFGKVGGLFGGGGSAATGNAGGRQESEQVGAQKLQMIQQKMSRLLDTLSNIMKSFHQTSSTAIRNIN